MTDSVTDAVTGMPSCSGREAASVESGTASASATGSGSGSGTGTGTPLRADALRNRRKILAAAKEMFALRGPDVPMEDVARRASVGVATLYRRFPDREALIRAVARDTFARVLEESRAAVAEEPGAWEALVRMLCSSQELQLSVQLAVHSRLVRDTVRDDPGTGRFRDELLGVLDRVVKAAQEEGTLRGDIGTGDVAALLSLLLRRAPDPPDGSAGAAAERAMGLMLDGLRARPGNTSLPGGPLSVGDFDEQHKRDLRP
ncbi:TetR/AcrR family transcriptional regulator [Streptomyces sp. WMMB 322]|uniref:TetR/AcrR family transcriptional regulator n=1 Tax=Streptomyces sp. WMMB 322 TaxID=1286821 RepID=UPI0020C7FE55|nr:TetR/AcrR family transcriptional regulator [Streptomyces sp. WMMB 322]